MRELIASGTLSELKYRNFKGIPQRAVELVREGTYPDMARAMKHMTMKYKADTVVRREYRRAVRRAARLHIAEQLAS